MKNRENMCAKGYRIFLLILLLLVLSGGIWYCYRVSQGQGAPEEGTLVQKMLDTSEEGMSVQKMLDTPEEGMSVQKMLDAPEAGSERPLNV